MSAPSSDRVAAARDGAELYRAMLRIRTVEDRLLVAYRDGLGNGPCHLAAGQEAVAVGTASVLRPGDATIGTYRGHGHVLARGAPVHGVIAEVFGRSTGLCGGKGGSMHLTSVAHGYYGSYAIVGAQLPIACGLAWAARLRGSDQVTVCFLGDGATNIGAFHEALNLAATWKHSSVFKKCEYSPGDHNICLRRVPRDAKNRNAEACNASCDF